MLEMVNFFMTNPNWDLVFVVTKNISLCSVWKWFQT